MYATALLKSHTYIVLVSKTTQVSYQLKGYCSIYISLYYFIKGSQSIWKTSVKGIVIGELSSFVSIISAI